MNAHRHNGQPAARPRPSLRDRLAGLAAALGLLAIVIGLPFVLVAIGANPLPSGVPSWDQVQTALTGPDDGTLFLRAIALVAWLAWAFMALSVLVEVVAQLRGVQAPRLRGLPGLQLSQGAARSLVATAALLFIAAPAVLQPGQPGTTPAAAAEPTHSAATATQGPLGTGAGDQTVFDRNLQAGNQESDQAGQAGEQGDRGDRQRPATKPHPVGAGETLWSIARTHLDDGARYPEIVELNRDLLGDDPGFLEVGWVLQVPDPDKPSGDGAVDVDLEDGERTVTVKPHDTLSEIADTELDDPNAYPKIFEASKDITQPGGAKLTDPDMIDVGWTLVIPADGASAGHNHGNDRDRGDRGGRDDRGEETPPSSEQDPPVEEPTEPPAEPDQSDQVDPGTQADGSERVDEAGASDGDTADEAGGLDAPWLLIGLTGGGVVLAAGLYRGLKARRRAQWRARRPGRAVAVPGPELAPVEKTINTTGASAAATVEFMDEALRRLAGQQSTASLPMPALAAVELNEHNLVLHLTDPIDLDSPWEGTADGMHWRCRTDVDLDDLGPALEELVDQPAPYPMLVTIGSSDDGDVWLLNCEELAAITITGDETYGRDFVRYLAAELAMNPWSDGIQVDCIGIAEEIAPMERDRIHYHPAAETSDSPAGSADPVGAVASDALADAVATIDRSTQAGVDVVTGRAAQVGADVWTARLILVDVTATRADKTAGLDAEDAETPDAGARSSRAAAGVAELVRLAVDHTGHTGTAVVIAGTSETESPDGEAAGTVLHMTSAGRVQLADAGLDLVAVGLTSDEAHGCAALLAQSEDTTDTEIPIDEDADEGWEAYATQSGSLRPEYTRPRGTASGTGAAAAASPYAEPTRPATLGYLEYAVRTDDAGAHDEDEVAQGSAAAAPESAARYEDPQDLNDGDDQDSDQDEDYAESVLTAPDEDYVAAAATTPEDLAALAPEVTARVRAEVEASDPGLDADVADWFATNSGRPKLTLLGPVAAQAHGKALIERKAYFTELLTYLALRRRHGVTPDEVADAFNLKAPKARGYVKVVRDWLGTNPATGTKHLPDATDAPATKTRGVNVYQIDDGLLVDADLFRRLYKRGQSRGPAGIEDLRRALDLVVGRPFDQLRKGAWSWLLEGDRTDHQMQAAVADVAHLVATHGLTTGDLDLARFAVEKATTAAPDEDTTQLNRAALAAAEGFPEEVERILRDEVCNRSDDGRAPLDLTARAEAILRNHDWLATG
ncbi:LysM peptidoglycan-binding domain-containing protein [Nocardioides marmoraquaticus]